MFYHSKEPYYKRFFFFFFFFYKILWPSIKSMLMKHFKNVLFTSIITMSFRRWNPMSFSWKNIIIRVIMKLIFKWQIFSTKELCIYIYIYIDYHLTKACILAIKWPYKFFLKYGDAHTFIHGIIFIV
jgi:hypothetical protein